MTLFPDPPAVSAFKSLSMDGSVAADVQLAMQEAISPDFTFEWSLSSNQEQFTLWHRVEAWTLDRNNTRIVSEHKSLRADFH